MPHPFKNSADYKYIVCLDIRLLVYLCKSISGYKISSFYFIKEGVFQEYLLMGAILSNYLLIVSVVACAMAQIIKTIIDIAQKKKIGLESIWATGGMPSSHSALVCALTVGTIKIYGWASPIFAITLMFSLVILRDALGVRRQVGEHAKALNMLFLEFVDIMEKQGPTNKEKVDKFGRIFSEMMGHTPLQVLMGSILGIVVGIVIPVFDKLS